jgi:hypothetical protein
MSLKRNVATLVLVTASAGACDKQNKDIGKTLDFRGSAYKVAESHRGPRDNFTTHRFESPDGKIFVVDLDDGVSADSFMPLYGRYYEGQGFTGEDVGGLQLFHNPTIEILITQAQGTTETYPVSFARRRQSPNQVFADREEIAAALSQVLNAQASR